MNYNHLDIEELRHAVRVAAEDMYKSEMLDTNMAILEIREEAEKYEHYADEEEKQEAIRNCSYETKEDWIEDRIQSWIKT